MKELKLKKHPSFYTDLDFSNWLVKDLLLGVTLDRKNCVRAVQMETRHLSLIRKQLQAKGYL